MIRQLKSIAADLTLVETVGDASRSIERIVFDSRQADADSLFVAQKGVASDGHDFIPAVFAQGCRAVMCERVPNGIPSDACVLVVPDTHEALGLAASSFYGHPSRRLRLVGVTGTNGKTTIATLLYRLTMALGHKAGLFSTVTNYIGTEQLPATHTTPDAVTLNSLMAKMVDEGCEYCFMEVSSHSVVQRRIAGLTFAGGLFTNITHDHLDYHKTFDAYIRAKKGFFDSLPRDAFAITNVDDRNGLVMVQNCAARCLTYSLRTMADFKADVVEHTFEGMKLHINGREVWMLFVGRFNVQNLLAVYGAAVELGFDSERVLTAMSALTPVSGRFETVRSADGRIAIIDYAHTPDALVNVISTINEIRSERQQLIGVVGCGGNRDATKRPEMAAEAAKGCSRVVLTSDNPRNEDPDEIIAQMKAGLDDEQLSRTIAITSRREAIRAALLMARPGDIVLVAGKGHETYQEIKGVRTHFDDHEEVREAFGIK